MNRRSWPRTLTIIEQLVASSEVAERYRQSTPASLSASATYLPKKSLPTRPTTAARRPSFANPTATLAGQPPMLRLVRGAEHQFSRLRHMVNGLADVIGDDDTGAKAIHGVSPKSKVQGQKASSAIASLLPSGGREPPEVP